MRCFLAAVPNQAILAISLLAAIGSSAIAQVVQLPSTRSLSYSGSTWVPDGGTASLGGGYSAYSSGSRRGASQVTAGELNESSLSASVQIIDLAALDEAILASPLSRAEVGAAVPAAGLPPGPGPGSEPASSESANGKTRVNPRPATDLSEPTGAGTWPDSGKYLRVLSGEGDVSGPVASQLESDIRYYVNQGEQAENAGRVIAARVFYKMARQLMTPELVERYERIVTERRKAEDARIQAELEAVRRKF